MEKKLNNHVLPKKRLLCILIACASIIQVTASIGHNPLITAPVSELQQQTISGKITDASTGESLPGVSVVIKGTTNGVVSDMDGKYSLKITDPNTVIVFSYIGYITEETLVQNRTQVDMTLISDIRSLEEVVVVGYGTMKKKDLTGASISIGGSSIANIPVTTAAAALTGKAAGVSIVTQNGAPGADINILVRGGTSITQSTEPLYIVDGFQMEKGLQNIDINDIETIDIMKDASSTAIYGARGSNGVILITTKSGKSGKTEITYNNYYSFEKLGKKMNLLNTLDYVKYQYEFQVLSGNEAKWASMFGGDVTASDFYTGAYNRIESDYGSREGIDWQKLVFGGTGITQNHNLNITGGNEKTKFLLSYNYTGQEGIMSKHGYHRNSIRAKLNHELRKGIRLDLNSGFQSTELDGGGSLGGMLKETILQPPTGGILYTNDYLTHSDISADMLINDSQYDIQNPLIVNNAVTQGKFTRLLTQNGGLEIDFLKDFTLRTAGSYLWEQIRSDYWDDGRTTTAKNYGGPYGSRDNSEKFTWQITNTLSWKHSFGSHNFNAMMGQETYYKQSIDLENEYHNFPDNNFGLNDVSMGTLYAKSSSKNKEGLVSVFSRLAYNYDNRYLVTGTLRGDGSSKFYKGRQWGSFPSASAAWRISEESFMKDQMVINNLKLRVGYGTSGNCSIDDNMYATDYQSGHYTNGASDYSTLIPGNIVGNVNLKWESITSTNIGLDVSALNSRLNLTLDYYRNKSDNLLIKNSIPTSTGYSYQYQNIGSISNRGIELIFNTVNIKSRDFNWNSSFNISFNRSKVLAIYGNNDDDNFITNYNSRIDYLIEVGKPLGQFYGYKYDGVYTTDDFTQNSNGSYSLKAGVPSLKGRSRLAIKPGDVKYATTAGQTDTDGNPIWSTDDRSVIGNAEPKFSGGLNNTFTYKGFDLSIFMNFVYGNKIFNMSSQRFIGPYLANQNSLSVMKDRFTLVDPLTGKETTNLDRLSALNPQQNSKTAMWSLHSDNKIAISDALDYYLEDGSFLRINNITLGYTLPKDFLKRFKIGKMRLYCTLNNIYTFTNYSGYDPEVSATSSLLTRGIDNSSYPRSKSYVIGLNLTF
jgi:TonB-dependent starch-binding outer membrane protein SusC